MRWKTMVTVAVTLLVLVLPLAAQQQQAPETVKVAVIDGQRVVNESAPGQSIGERAEVAQQQWTERINQARQELDALMRQRQDQALTLNEEALARLNTQIEEKQVEIQRLQDDANRQLRNLSQQLMDELNTVLVPQVRRLAEREGYHLILDASRMQEMGLLYFASSLDVTDRFIEMVNLDAQSTGEPGPGFPAASVRQ